MRNDPRIRQLREARMEPTEANKWDVLGVGVVSFPWMALGFALMAWGVAQLAHAVFWVANALDPIVRLYRAGVL